MMNEDAAVASSWTVRLPSKHWQGSAGTGLSWEIIATGCRRRVQHGGTATPAAAHMRGVPTSQLRNHLAHESRIEQPSSMDCDILGRQLIDFTSPFGPVAIW